MRQRVCIRLTVALLFVLAAGVPARPQAGGMTLVKPARILDIDSGAYKPNQVVLVQGDRIRFVGDPGALPPADRENAVVVDLPDVVLLPGLVDAHAHLLAEMPLVPPGPAIILAVTQMSAAKRALLGARMAREDLEAGFTTVRNLGHAGIDGDIALREAVNAGWVEGPRLAASGRKITPIGGQAVQLQPGLTDALLLEDFLPINGAAEARRAVLENLYRGADWIKIVVSAGARSLTLNEVQAVVAEAHRSKLRVAAHATTPSAVQTCIDAGVDSIEHGDLATDEQLRAMHEKGIFLTPTDTMTNRRFLELLERTYAVPEADHLRLVEQDRQSSAQSRDRLQRAIKAGVRVAAGSDMWSEFSGKTRGQATMMMLDALQEEGMKPIDVIRAATRTAADLLDWSDRIGSIAPGRFADLVGVEGDPLANVEALRHVTFLMKGGKVVKTGPPGRH